MGEITDMMLEGLLDEETGEYIGDVNAAIYGTESPGFPISYEREAREYINHIEGKVTCPLCNKLVKKAGLSMHKRDVHGK